MSSETTRKPTVGMHVRITSDKIYNLWRCRNAVIVGVTPYEVTVELLHGPHRQKRLYFGLSTFWRYCHLVKEADHGGEPAAVGAAHRANG